MKTIVIDAGHGGSDPGVTYPAGPPLEAIEKGITLDLAKQLQHALLGLGWPVAVELTRDHDEDLSLAARGALAKKHGADLVLSLHVNSSPDPKVSGLMTFCWPGNARMRAVGLAISRCAPDALRRPSTLCWEATDAPGPEDDWLRRSRNVLAAFEAPAVLIEMAHMTNADDRREILDARVQRGVVAACVAGVAQFLETD